MIALSDPRYIIGLLVIVLLAVLMPPRLRLFLVLAASVVFYVSLGPTWYILPWVGLVGYFGGMVLASIPDGRLRTGALWLAILAALAPLAYFKYAPTILGPLLPVGANPFAGGLILPVGISFFSFSVVGYLIDVYVGTLVRVSNPVRFALFATYFPHLTQGPIARGGQFFPQLDRLGHLEYERAVSGLRMILLGFFLKIVVADSLAPLVNQVYGDIGSHQAADYTLSTVYFVFQVYADFAGYSLIAIGSSRILGIDLTPNFAQPYLATTIPDFWRRWHISMSSWFRSYIFAPIQARFRDWPTLSLIGAMLITFVAVGVWHGAGATYVLFGIIHGTLAAVSTLTLAWRNRTWERIGLHPKLLWSTRLMVTFSIICVTFALFRAASLEEAWTIYSRLLRGELGSVTIPVAQPAILISLVIGLDVLAYRKVRFDTLPRLARWSVYYATIGVIVAVLALHGMDGTANEQQFIYYKF